MLQKKVKELYSAIPEEERKKMSKYYTFMELLRLFGNKASLSLFEDIWEDKQYAMYHWNRFASYYHRDVSIWWNSMDVENKHILFYHLMLSKHYLFENMRITANFCF